MRLGNLLQTSNAFSKLKSLSSGLINIFGLLVIQDNPACILKI